MKAAISILASFLTAVSLAEEPGCDFKAADKNNDGLVSVQEYKKYRAIIMKKDGWSDPYHQIMSTFSERDQDGDGYLTPEEMKLAVACNRLKDTFQERNGQLNFEEFETFVERMLMDHGQSAMRCQLAEAFKLQDRDQDGKLNREEFTGIYQLDNLRFQLADEDHDHLLDIIEFEVFAVGRDNLELLADVTDVQGWVENIFENRDDDEDEFLSRAELYETSAERHKRFKRADTDRDGYVDLCEIQTFKVNESDLSLWRDMAMDQFWLNFINRDKDANGIITQEEYYSEPEGLGNQIAFSVIK
jgi:Ca2+-binding EF-hand superfamily protein